MAMTEKQGGSDVRANTTRAIPVAADGPGKAYELVGHKYFVSAPMRDAFLVLAQAPGGLSCFLVPRWRPDGTESAAGRSPQAKDGQCLQCVERDGAARRARLDGRRRRTGRATIIEMVAMTRFDCMIGSSAGMRRPRARRSIIAASARRSAHSDRAANHDGRARRSGVEAEAALALTMRVGRALDNRHDAARKRSSGWATALGKYWICKRRPRTPMRRWNASAASGVMEDCPMPRLFREVADQRDLGRQRQRAVPRRDAGDSRSPETVQAYFAEVGRRGRERRARCACRALKEDCGDLPISRPWGAGPLRPAGAGPSGRRSPSRAGPVADAFCRSRLESRARILRRAGGDRLQGDRGARATPR